MSRRAVASAALSAALLAPAVALANDTDDIQSLLEENVITTASTKAEVASTAPATSVTLTADDLRTYGIRSTDEAVRFLSVGVVTSDPLRTPDMGARGSVGAKNVAALSLSLEELGASGTVVGAESWLAALPAALEVAMAALRKAAA